MAVPVVSVISPAAAPSLMLCLLLLHLPLSTELFYLQGLPLHHHPSVLNWHLSHISPSFPFPPLLPSPMPSLQGRHFPSLSTPHYRTIFPDAGLLAPTQGTPESASVVVFMPCASSAAASGPDPATGVGRTGISRMPGSIQLYDVAAGELLGTLTGHKSQVNAVAYRACSQELFSAGDDGHILRWQPALLFPLAARADK